MGGTIRSKAESEFNPKKVTEHESKVWIGGQHGVHHSHYTAENKGAVNRVKDRLWRTMKVQGIGSIGSSSCLSQN